MRRNVLGIFRMVGAIALFLEATILALSTPLDWPKSAKIKFAEINAKDAEFAFRELVSDKERYLVKIAFDPIGFPNDQQLEVGIYLHGSKIYRIKATHRNGDTPSRTAYCEFDANLARRFLKTLKNSTDQSFKAPAKVIPSLDSPHYVYILELPDQRKKAFEAWGASHEEKISRFNAVATLLHHLVFSEDASQRAELFNQIDWAISEIELADKLGK